MSNFAVDFFIKIKNFIDIIKIQSYNLSKFLIQLFFNQSLNILQLDLINPIPKKY